ncbi:hypothetical protein DQ04_00081100 [Trypanosoma grayi]|uniref:hypothetical protein n=1 Tax=Trypanosoma grayi TaxID=71804 RepID=UPI0004F49AF2|nr:hypothetical protein DQ04_00081100 [Trypanosoma grayi]KEG15411.1 hypothetical protein DQ04_00081100 [Trypanosoma grayi]
MGCKGSCARSPKKKNEPEAEGAENEPVSAGDNRTASIQDPSIASQGSARPLPAQRARSESPTTDQGRGVSRQESWRDGKGSSAPLPLIVVPVYGNNNNNNNNNPDDEESLLLSFSSTSSTPQLFRIEPTQRAQRGDGTWEWWYEQVEKLRITKDYTCREKLQDIPNRLTRQYDADKGRVELDLSWCYMERSAPYVLGRLLASPFLCEVRWITALRLDGNYFTDDGFGNMLAVMSEANEKKTILPLLKHLYLNNMNLDPCSTHGILFYLFPLDWGRSAGSLAQPTIAGDSVGLPVKAYTPFNNYPRSPLFPSLEVLSLCDNPGIGNRGLAEALRCFIAPHREGRVLPVLDLSRCAIDEVGVRYIREYLTHLPVILESGERAVIVRRIVLFGNRHSIEQAGSAVLAPCDSDFTLIL